MEMEILMGEVVPFRAPKCEIRKATKPVNPKLRYLVRGSKPKNRVREYLTEQEVKRIIDSIKGPRTGQRDKLMIWLMYRHGYRASEICNALWTSVDFKNARIHVKRLKGSDDAVHPLSGDELRALRRWQRHQPVQSAYIFTAWSAAPLHRRTLYCIVRDAGRRANIGIDVYPHILRHSCGTALAQKGVDLRVIQAFLGHRSVQNTVRYTKLSPKQFETIWD